MSDIALDEKLDTLDPLRHLRNNDELDLIPAQPPSIHNQTIELAFPSSDDPEAYRIKLSVDASPGCGGIAWPAGEVLSRYISRKGGLKGKNILELGSGTGLVGLVAGLLGANVWITDQSPLLDIMARNVELNALQDHVVVKELNWGEPVPQDLLDIDMILAADCVYFEPAFPLLVQTLKDLAAGRNSDILFCYKKRRKADKRFFALLKKEFNWSEVLDDPDRENYHREAISLLRLTRKH
ncbi:putative methyltransferase-domain-containing protein [Abortiporus biennis]|nr:putative methyltransferase-domain-containing protein [Abortiporus biennis]